MIYKALMRMRDILDRLETALPETDEVIDAIDLIRDGIDRLENAAQRKADE